MNQKIVAPHPIMKCPPPSESSTNKGDGKHAISETNKKQTQCVFAHKKKLNLTFFKQLHSTDVEIPLD